MTLKKNTANATTTSAFTTVSTPSPEKQAKARVANILTNLFPDVALLTDTEFAAADAKAFTDQMRSQLAESFNIPTHAIEAQYSRIVEQMSDEDVPIKQEHIWLATNLAAARAKLDIAEEKLGSRVFPVSFSDEELLATVVLFPALFDAWIDYDNDGISGMLRAALEEAAKRGFVTLADGDEETTIAALPDIDLDKLKMLGKYTRMLMADNPESAPTALADSFLSLLDQKVTDERAVLAHKLLDLLQPQKS